MTVSFGALSVTRSSVGGCASETRGLFGGGYAPANSNVIDYVTIASTGNATDFGDLTVARFSPGALASPTRAVFGGGSDGGNSNFIDYVTIASTGNAADFGDLTVGNYGAAGASNAAAAVQPTPTSAAMALFGGGATDAVSQVSTINYVNIATTGNALLFGDLSVARNALAGCASSTRAIFGGGDPAGADETNVIDFTTFSSFGNCTDFGDLTGNAHDKAWEVFSIKLNQLFGLTKPESKSPAAAKKRALLRLPKAFSATTPTPLQLLSWTPASTTRPMARSLRRF